MNLPSIYPGVVIIASCTACLIPLELFLIEIWPRHGLSSLLLVIAPLAVGRLIGRRLPARYYRVRPFETRGRLYRRLGIQFFKRFVPDGDCINGIVRRHEPGYRVVGDRRSLVTLEARTRLAERLHFASLFLPVPCTAYALMLGWPAFSLVMFLPNIPFHLYPILLQRYTRARIHRVLARRLPA